MLALWFGARDRCALGCPVPTGYLRDSGITGHARVSLPSEEDRGATGCV